MLKESHGKSSAGNYTLEGHSVDLIDGIANLLNFSYEFYIVPDKHYGSYHPETKQWDGLIREILDRVTKNNFNLSCFCFYIIILES